MTKVFRPPPAPWRRLLGRAPEPDTVALRNVSLTLQPGEILGLVGPNGAGKTVPLKLPATLNEPTEGAVTIFGLDSVRDSRAIRFQVGMATCDERSFYWRLTAWQNLMFFAKLAGLSRVQARHKVSELLELLDLRPIENKSYRVLSTGNRQRLAIARALILDPKVLLLDEPTNSLDPIAANRLRAIVHDRIHGSGDRAILITSHNLEEVQDLSHRIAVLNHGQVLEVDELPVLCRRYGTNERVTIRTRSAIPTDLLHRLQRLAPDARSLDDNALAFEQQSGDGRTHEVLATILGAGIEVVRCDTVGGSLKEVFNRLIAKEVTDE